MADKNKISRNGIDERSSPIVNEEFNYFTDPKPMPGSPESTSSLSDEFMANLLSENGMPRCILNEKCNKQCNNVENSRSSCNQLKDVSTICSELTVASTSCNGSLESKELANDNLEIINSEGKTKLKNEMDLPVLNMEEQKQGKNFEDGIDSSKIHIKYLEPGKEDNLSSEPLTIEAVEKHNELNKEGYRCGSDSSDDSSSTFSLDSKSDCSDSFLHKMQMNVNTSSNKVASLKTKGELDLEELPLIEDLKISVKETEIEKVGIIHAIVNTLVIVRAMRNLQPLDIDSVLFLTPQKPLGRVFEVFGPISEPYYIVRFNNAEHVKDAGVTKDSDVFYAPQKEEITSYVFVDELQRQKGSDASWKDNNEPPEEFIDYSDDEQEKAAKQKRKAKNRSKPFDDEIQEIKRDQSSSMSRTVLLHSPVAATAVNTFHSTRPVMSKPNNSSYLSMAAVMSSSYRPNTSRSQNAFQGPPLYAQPRNPFGTPQSSIPPLLAAPPPKVPDRPSGAPFYPTQPFMQQQNMAPGAYHPPQSPLQLQSPVCQPVRMPHVFLQHGTDSKSFAFQQSHVFGQVTPLGPISPAHPSVNFAPTVMSPPPLIPVSIPPPSPNFSYFSHNFASSPSPPAPGQIFPNSSWFQGQSASRPNMRFVAPMSPLSIQIPNNLRTPPPTMLTNGYNSVPPMHPPQNTRPPYMLQAGTRHY